jgi:Mg2+/Co2+ transporter CorB
VSSSSNFIGVIFANKFVEAVNNQTKGFVITPNFLLGGSAIARTASAAIVMILLTYVSIVFGELYPKRIAMTKTKLSAKEAPDKMLTKVIPTWIVDKKLFGLSITSNNLFDFGFPSSRLY